MPTLVEDLERIETDAAAFYARLMTPSVEAALKRVQRACEEAHKGFCGSWLGHHSRVYYAELHAPPPGAHFSAEWGMDSAFGHGTVGDWREYDGHQLIAHFESAAGKPSFEKIGESFKGVGDPLDNLREELLSILDACLAKSDDEYLKKLKEQAENARPKSFRACVDKYRPTGQFMSRDMVAVSAGQQIPPHFQVMAQVDAYRAAFDVADSIARIAKRTAAHFSKKEKTRGIASKQGNKIFIGHGGSAAWRELKDFIEERLELEVDEFNRKPVAGITNIVRLSEMLDDAAIGFLVMTAEDEQADGSVRARQNVIHEAGLFQGRLGFTRAIIVLEEGCEAFSNIDGLGHIRFPKKKIKAAFEEVRQVLEREGLLPS